MEELVPIIQHAAFTVVPFGCYSNYSMVILESLSCGTVVIGSNIGGIPKLISDSWNSLLFEVGNDGQLADRIQFMLSDRQKAIEMTEWKAASRARQRS
jgi:glycosyltransferase involved in cell wall biosynthesis